MVIEIKVPDIGADEVEVTEIMVKIGDKIETEQPLIVVEGNKASIEIPSPQAGIVKDIRVSIGDKVEAGKLIMIFDSVDATKYECTPILKKEIDVQPLSEITSISKDVNIPDIGKNEVEVTEILVKVGDRVKVEQSLIVVKRDKSSIEIPAPFAGIVKEIKISIGDKVSTGSIIMQFEVAIHALDVSTIKNDIVTSTLKKIENDCSINLVNAKDSYKDKITEYDSYNHATPIIRRLAREIGIDLAKVKGTGRKGRILKEDIYTYIKEATKHIGFTPVTGGNIPNMLPWPKIEFSKFGEIQEVELGRIQKISGANLSRNWMMIPHVTHFDKSDITELEAFRKQQNIEIANRGINVKITPVAFIMKAVAYALKQMPRFNSSLSEDNQKLILKQYINIGIAVDTPNGLVVPVFKNVNKKGIIELSRELIITSKKARDGKLTASEMQGGCFTISSIGSLGTTYFTPIVSAPEVAILGVSKSVIEPIWNGKEFVPRLMLPISLSFDHRVIDGADGARFITIINNALSDIRRLMM